MYTANMSKCMYTITGSTASTQRNHPRILISEPSHLKIVCFSIVYYFEQRSQCTEHVLTLLLQLLFVRFEVIVFRSGSISFGTLHVEFYCAVSSFQCPQLLIVGHCCTRDTGETDTNALTSGVSYSCPPLQDPHPFSMCPRPRTDDLARSMYCIRCTACLTSTVF